MATRRAFVVGAVALAGSPAWAQTRLNVAEIDRARIMAAAAKAVASPAKPNGDPQSNDFLQLTLQVPALAAASVVVPDDASKYAAAAGALLDAWFLNPGTRPTLELSAEGFEPLIGLAGLAEVAVALPFLALAPAQMARLKASFAKYLTFLTEDRTALLARDAKNHHASAWLLQVAAFARLTGNETLIAESSHRFKSSTIRAQIDSKGEFPHELRTGNAYRDSLFNLDLLAGVCVLLSSRFDSLWDHELQDGPGMRTAIAYHVPYIRNRKTWPYPADDEHFNDLPCRRPALLFAARAYTQADYAALWKTLDPDPADPVLLRTFPIRQPLLWQTPAPRRTE